MIAQRKLKCSVVVYIAPPTPFFSSHFAVRQPTIKTSNKEVRLQISIAWTEENKQKKTVGEMFSNRSVYELLLVVFKGQVIFFGMVENLDLKEKDAVFCRGTERHWESVGIVSCLQNARTNNQTICKQLEDKS